MTDYSRSLRGLSDDQLADILAGGPMPGSTNHEIIKFEMQRRVAVAQKLAAEATLRGAVAAERYTKGTWALILVSVAGIIVSVLK